MRLMSFHSTRCVEGRVMRHDPQHDDPDLETDIGQCEECAGKGCIACEDCGELAPDASDDGDGLCENCLQNRAEAAYERHCEAFHDGGATQFRSLRDQQIEAQKLK